MVKLFVIVTITDFDELGIEILEPEHGPREIFCERDPAENEMLRLQQKFPEERFMLCESISYTKPGIKKGLFFVEKIEGE